MNKNELGVISMRYIYLVLLVLIMNGCAMDDTIRKGDREQAVINRYGKPDVITERSGDIGRSYSKESKDITDYKWPNAIKTYYYLEAEVKVRMQYHEVISVDAISEKDKKLVYDVLESERN